MSDSIEVKSVTEKLVLIGCDVRSLSGTITRPAEDRQESDKDVFTAGSVRYVHPGVLRPLAAARQSATRILRGNGTRFWGAWAVAEESVPALMQELGKIAEFVRTNKETIVGDWNKSLAEWEEIHPAAGSYRKRFPTQAQAERGLGVAISVVRINPTDIAVPGADDAITQEIKGLPQQILEEIAADVRDTWKVTSTKATQQIKNLLRRIAGKCHSLAFVGGNLKEVAIFIEETILRLPQSGEIVGNDYLILSGLLSILENPELVAKGNFRIEVAPDDLLDAEVGKEEDDDVPMPVSIIEQSKAAASASAAFSW